MQYRALLKKMKTEISGEVQYYLNVEDNFLNLNQLLDKTVQLKFVGYECLCCGKEVKIFRQGFCYSCFYESAQVGDWIMKPELSKAHLGIEDRDLAYEQEVQLKPHVVYLALSSNVKVGVTRKTQVPTRWIDQGASKAVAVVEVPNRYLAGITEVALKEYVADKTSWQKMLKNDIGSDDLLETWNELVTHVPDEAKPYVLKSQTEVLHLEYPVKQYPKKVTSLNLEKRAEYTGVLKGVKGQYLIFEDGTVFNVRNNEGLKVELSVS